MNIDTRFMKVAERAVRVLLQNFHVSMRYTSHLLSQEGTAFDVPTTEVQLAVLVLELDLNSTRSEIKYLQAKARMERYALHQAKMDLKGTLRQEKRDRNRAYKN